MLTRNRIIKGHRIYSTRETLSFIDGRCLSYIWIAYIKIQFYNFLYITLVKSLNKIQFRTNLFLLINLFEKSVFLLLIRKSIYFEASLATKYSTTNDSSEKKDN